LRHEARLPNLRETKAVHVRPYLTDDDDSDDDGTIEDYLEEKGLL
jgi:hypothetical protein